MSFPKFLRIAVFNPPKNVQINSTTSVKIRIPDELSVRFAKIFSHSLDFSYKIITPTDNQFGRRLPNGSWTGLIRLLLRDEADIITTPIMLSEQRQEAVDFTYPFHVDRITFATRKPEYVTDYSMFLKPFSYTVWSLTVISFLVMSVLLFVSFQRKYSFLKLTLYLLSTLFWQSIAIHPLRNTDYFLISSWTTGIMFLGYAYTADLLSFLTVPPVYGVRTIPELVDAVSKDVYTCHVFPGAFFGSYVRNSIDPNLKVINEKSRSGNPYLDIDKVLSDRTLSTKPAFIAGTKFLLPFKLKYFVSEDVLFTASSSIAMKKDFCCKKQLSTLISYVWAAGLYQKLLNDLYFNISLEYMPRDEETLEKPLTIGDLFGALLLLVCGYILSICALLTELLVGKVFAFRHLNKIEMINNSTDGFEKGILHNRKRRRKLRDKRPKFY